MLLEVLELQGIMTAEDRRVALSKPQRIPTDLQF